MVSVVLAQLVEQVQVPVVLVAAPQRVPGRCAGSGCGGPLVDTHHALRERIASLEAERDRIKAYNASCRRSQPDPSLLDDQQRADLESVKRVASYQLGKGGSFPSYALSNLSGNLARNRQRLARLLDEADGAGPAEGQQPDPDGRG